jgi:meiotically up-regulated gene 157 (Mug157) protein
MQVDGLGNLLLMDDANIPSLLSAPYMGYKNDDKVYANTRAFIFSKDNPTYFSGTNSITGAIDGYGLGSHLQQYMADGYGDAGAYE